jgi:phosphoribosylamine---glycine ligase
MKFLIIGEEFMATSLAWRLQHFENQDVRVWCKKEEGKEHLQNMVQQVDSLGEGLRWVGRDGYVISEDEKDMTKLRKMGFRVYGGNKLTERMENDRIFEMEKAQKYGLSIPNFHHVKSVNEAIAFVKKNPDAYVLKQMANLPKEYNYVGKDDDGGDIILQLEWMKTRPEFKKYGNPPFMLQEVVEGIEFACSAVWTGKDWLKDSDENVILEYTKEHKKSEDGGIGKTCGESGSVMLITSEHTKLFEETVNKFTPMLIEECPDIRVIFDCNCGIADEDGKITPYLFETTIRFGYPECALEQYLLKTKVSDYMADVINSQSGNIEWNKDWGVVTVLGAGNYPHERKANEGSFKDQPVKFPFEEWDEHVAPGYIRYDNKDRTYRISDNYEDVCQITYSDSDIKTANKQCVQMMESIVVRDAHFRHDIGTVFADKELDQLKSWGYL